MATTTAPAPVRRLPAAARAGYVLAGVLGLFDLGLNALTLPAGDTAIIGLICGVATLVAIPFGLRSRPWGRITIAASRIVSALTAAPTFFVHGISAAWVITAAVFIPLCIVDTVLVLRRSR